MVAQMGRWVLAGAILLLVAVGQGDDIIFSAARLKGVRGAYKAIDSAHIYRVREDGSGMRQLTSSSESDTNPCLTVDGKEILFWRRNRNDLVGDIRLCSVALDGTRFKVIRNFEDVDLTRPIDAARLLTGNRKIHTSVGTDKWGEMRVLIAQPGGKGNFTQWSAVSPSGRYVWVASEDKDSPFLDLVSGRIWSLKGLPSEAGARFRSGFIAGRCIAGYAGIELSMQSRRANSISSMG